MVGTLTSSAVNVLVYWSANIDPVARYKLSVGLDPVMPFTNIYSSASYAAVNNLTSGQTYYFSLTAQNQEGYESNPTEPLAFTIPSSIATATASWDPNVEAVQNTQRINYYLAVNLDGSAFTNVKTTNISAAIPGLTVGRTYTFSLLAENDEGQISNPSDVVSFTIPDVAPIETNTNLPPVATPRSLKMTVNTSLPFTLRGSDPNKDPLYYVIRTQPKFGTIIGTPPNIRYTPKANYVGLDSFTFTVADRQFTSAPATVSLSVQAP